MATQSEINEAKARWAEHCKLVQAMTGTEVLVQETPSQKQKRIKRLLAHYDQFCEYYFPHYLTRTDPDTGKIKITHNAPFHNKGAEKLRKNRNYNGDIGRIACQNEHYRYGAACCKRAVDREVGDVQQAEGDIYA